MGPWIVTTDESATRPGLSIWLAVNGVPKQASNTDQLIFGCRRTSSAISAAARPCCRAAVIATGTPGGVGFTPQPPVFLRPGDVVELTVEGIGTLAHPVGGDAPPPPRTNDTHGTRHGRGEWDRPRRRSAPRRRRHQGPDPRRGGRGRRHGRRRRCGTIAEVVGRIGPIDILVNSARVVGPDKPLVEVNDAEAVQPPSSRRRSRAAAITARSAPS